MAWKFVDQDMPKEKPEESYAGKALRTATGVATSGLAGLASVPRGIADVVQGIRGATTNWAKNQLSPEEQKTYHAGSSGLSGIDKAISGAQKMLPTSEDVKSGIGKHLPEDYLKPQGETEEFAQDMAETIGSLMFPLGGTATKLSKAAKIAGLGSAGKFLTKTLGGSESDQELVKSGTMLLTSFGMQQGLKDRAKDMYQKAEEILPQNLTLSSESLREVAQKADRFAQSGFSTSNESKAIINQALADMGPILNQERVLARDVIAYKRDMGDLFKKARYEPRAKKYLTEMKSALDNMIKNNKEMPKDVSKLLVDADSIYTGVNQSEKALEYIRNIPKISKSLSGTSALIGLALNPKATVAAGAAGAGVYGGVKLGYALNNYFFNPSIGNEYNKMMAAALKENAPSVIKHAAKLDEEVKKIDAIPQGKWRFV